MAQNDKNEKREKKYALGRVDGVSRALRARRLSAR